MSLARSRARAFAQMYFYHYRDSLIIIIIKTFEQLKDERNY